MVVQYRSGDEKFPEKHDLRERLSIPLLLMKDGPGMPCRILRLIFREAVSNPE